MLLKDGNFKFWFVIRSKLKSFKFDDAVCFIVPN